VYKLQVELYQYSSERIDTGVPEVDAFETLKTFSTNITRSGAGRVKSITVTNGGSGYTEANVSITSVSGVVGSVGIGAEAQAVIADGVITSINVTDGGAGYKDIPSITIEGDGVNALAEAIVEIDIDKVESYGDNNSFKDEAQDLIFNEFNPFGDMDP
jgi:hypothetical protein